MLIGLTGKKRVGKDTVAGILVDRYGFKQLSFAAPLKQAASILLRRSMMDVDGSNPNREEIDPYWGFSIRSFLELLGTDAVRQFDQDFWIKRLLLEHGDRFEEPGVHNNTVISDVRFENEAALIRDSGGAIWHIKRDTEASTGVHESNLGVVLHEKDRVLMNVESKIWLEETVVHLLQTHKWRRAPLDD